MRQKEAIHSRAYLILRSVVLWLVSAAHFFTVCPLLVLLALFKNPRHNDEPQRWFSRNVVRLDDDAEYDRRRCLFLSFNNSKFTGGKMMIAPLAETSSGKVEYVRWGPIGRLGLVRMLPRLYDGTHLEHRLAERRAARRVEFELDGPVDVMVDGEVMTVECRRIEVLPGAMDVMV